MSAEPQNDWAVVELMGHVRLVGILSEEEKFGTKLGRIDVLHRDGSFVTQFFGGGSVYRITPTTEEAARQIMAPWPVHSLQARPEETAADDTTGQEDDIG